jgi:hypothetical protein
MAKGKLTPDDYAKAKAFIADAIEEHEKATAADQSKLEYAIAAGEKLLEAKAIFGSHDRKWTKWLEDNCKAFSQRTAYRYMDFAEHRDAIMNKFATRGKNEDGDDRSSIRWAEELVRQIRADALTEEERQKKEADKKTREEKRKEETATLKAIRSGAPDALITAVSKLPPADRDEVIRGVDPTPATVEDVLRSVADWDTDNLKALALGISRIVDERKPKPKAA